MSPNNFTSNIYRIWANELTSIHPKIISSTGNKTSLNHFISRSVDSEIWWWSLTMKLRFLVNLWDRPLISFASNISLGNWYMWNIKTCWRWFGLCNSYEVIMQPVYVKFKRNILQKLGTNQVSVSDCFVWHNLQTT